MYAELIGRGGPKPGKARGGAFLPRPLEFKRKPFLSHMYRSRLCL